jgi:hypothetical protein
VTILQHLRRRGVQSRLVGASDIDADSNVESYVAGSSIMTTGPYPYPDATRTIHVSTPVATRYWSIRQHPRRCHLLFFPILYWPKIASSIRGDEHARKRTTSTTWRPSAGGGNPKWFTGSLSYDSQESPEQHIDMQHRWRGNKRDTGIAVVCVVLSTCSTVLCVNFSSQEERQVNHFTFQNGCQWIDSLNSNISPHWSADETSVPL